MGWLVGWLAVVVVVMVLVVVWFWCWWSFDSGAAGGGRGVMSLLCGTFYRAPVMVIVGAYKAATADGATESCL